MRNRARPKPGPTSSSLRGHRPTSTPSPTRIAATGRRAIAVPTDVTESDQLQHLTDRAIEELGRIDILVNNAGGWDPRPVMDTSPRAMEAAFRFNVLAAFRRPSSAFRTWSRRAVGAS